MSAEGSPWGRRNLYILRVFAPLLLVTGLLGFVLPARLALMSGAPAYNVFHLFAGAFGLGLVRGKSTVSAARFNFAFGAIDLYQALAGLMGWFPAGLFALRPADHVVHVLVGLLLVGAGWLGTRRG